MEARPVMAGRLPAPAGSLTLPSSGRRANLSRNINSKFTRPSAPVTASKDGGGGQGRAPRSIPEGQTTSRHETPVMEKSVTLRKSRKLPAEKTTSIVFGNDVDISELAEILGRLRVVAGSDTRGRLSVSRDRGTKTLPPPARGRRPKKGETGDSAGPSKDSTEQNARTYKRTTDARPIAGTSKDAADGNSRSTDDSTTKTLPKSQKQKGKAKYVIRRLEPGLLDRAEVLLGQVTLERKRKPGPNVTVIDNVTSVTVGETFPTNHGVNRRVQEIETHGSLLKRAERDGVKPVEDIEKKISFCEEMGEHDLTVDDGGAGVEDVWDVDDVEPLLCGCCYIELLDDMVQCSEGHLFCVECLHDYAQEVVYGQARPPLMCMTEDCDVTFPHSQIQRALSAEEVVHYEQRLQSEAILMAGLLNKIIRCPRCDFPVLPDAQLHVFRCPECRYKSCRYCRESWKIHEGLTCEQVEQKDETKVRLTYEERMTKATIRICQKCQASFTKSDGCNYMKCRCGAVMCYICRLPDITYQHFCKHPHDPGLGCRKCTRCYLWTNPDEDEKRAIDELKKEAELERKRLGYDKKRVIGVPTKADDDTDGTNRNHGDGVDEIMMHEEFSDEDSGDSSDDTESDLDEPR